MTKSSLLNFGTGEVISRRCKDHNLRKEAAHDGSRRKEAWKLDFESRPLESSGKYCTAAADAQRIGIGTWKRLSWIIEITHQRCQSRCTADDFRM
jgi:hypothetical protein